jgi:hypothetical protein
VLLEEVNFLIQQYLCFLLDAGFLKPANDDSLIAVVQEFVHIPSH